MNVYPYQVAQIADTATQKNATAMCTTQILYARRMCIKPRRIAGDVIMVWGQLAKVTSPFALIAVKGMNAQGATVLMAIFVVSMVAKTPLNNAAAAVWTAPNYPMWQPPIAAKTGRALLQNVKRLSTPAPMAAIACPIRPRFAPLQKQPAKRLSIARVLPIPHRWHVRVMALA